MKPTKLSIIMLTIIFTLCFSIPTKVNAVVYPGDNLIVSIASVPNNVGGLVDVLVNDSNSIRFDIPYDNSGSVTESFTVPTGENYTLKVIGFKQDTGNTFPSVLVDGKASNIDISQDQATTTNLTLEVPKIEVDTSTPTQVRICDKFTIKLNITDPGDLLQDTTRARLWWNTVMPSMNMNGSQVLN